MPSVAAVIRDFWLNGYSAVRDAAGEDIGVMIGDAFMGVGVSFAIKTSEGNAEALHFLELAELLDASTRSRRPHGFP